tara:strand:+ start:2482 stop:2733 length:252 start_codon:yes stop_codon:yes gene_type:complete
MPTTDEIFAEFKEVIKRIDDDRLRNKLGNVVIDSITKHRENDYMIKQLKINMEAQKKLFLTNLEGLEDKKCPHPLLAKAGAHH